ncbi:hypothetical protein Rsub_10110 [Raphidocelis subcapitata]|uniref:Phosphatidylglycerol lysyltransferase C-terminal domain-containing protein n=1 Tax=Raphidocelis subcapitata TaxID=307507 RepID=A0A2V0PC35_9CHLO|nr:hypothetical protein Rsub_10110 [Raphidocelis subcapitata]|eukprot:GBF97099.1 hypothetical protein Rsub_10110 [Raphidocelis subcapitata]
MGLKGGQLPWPLEHLMCSVVGIIFNQLLTWCVVWSFFESVVRRLRGIPDWGVPRPATARVPAPAEVKAPRASDAATKALAADDASDAASDDAVAEIDAPRAPAAAKAAKAAAAAAAAGTLEVPVQHIEVDAQLGTKCEAWRLVGPYLRQYGSGALSSSTLWNPEFTHLFIPGVGSQPYVVARAYCRAVVVGIGDPLAAREHWPVVIDAFLAAFPKATYAHVGPEFGAVLRDHRGMQVQDIGAETNVMVQTWAYGKKTRTIKNAARDARAAGVRVRELRSEDLTPEVCKQLAHVTGDWIQKKSVKENTLRVFIRHVDYDALHLEQGVRLFIAETPEPAPAAAAAAPPDAKAAGAEDDASSCTTSPSSPRPAGPARARLEGFVMVDPLWRGGEVYGYVTSLNRMRQGSHHGTLKLLYETVFAAAKADGKEMVTFGFSPFFNLQMKPFCTPMWCELGGRWLFNHGNNLYQFKNLAFSKARYGGSVEGDSYKDPNVTMTHVYGVHRMRLPGTGILEQYITFMYVGFMGDIFDTLLKLTGIRTTVGNATFAAEE